MKSRMRIKVVVGVAGVVALVGYGSFKLVNSQITNPSNAPVSSGRAVSAPAVEMNEEFPTDSPVQQAPEEDRVIVAASVAPVSAPALTRIDDAPDTQTPPGAVDAAAVSAETPSPLPANAGADPALTGEDAINSKLTEAKDLAAQGKKYEARVILTKLILSAQEGPRREELRRMLDEINKELFFSRAPSPDCESYTVQKGDALALIAGKYGKDVHFSRLIMQVNGLNDPKRLNVGRTLKIPVGQFSAIVQKSAHRLVILLNGYYIKEYLVATGSPITPTPPGSFVVDNTKAQEPQWYAPEGVVYKFGDPKNILGTRWIGLKDTNGIGIHGTTEPETVGSDVSNGCIRMINADVEEVFSMLMPGDTVEIVK